MKYTIYEHPTTRKFAHLPLPPRFLEGDPLPEAVIDRWFESRDAAIAALAELLDRDETGPASAAAQTTTEVAPEMIGHRAAPVRSQH
jgi:hypothetical protein